MTTPPLDPSGQWEWDGSRWVPHIAAEPAPTAALPTVTPGAPIPPPEPAQQSSRTPWYRRAWVLPVGVGVVALLAGIGIGSGSASSKTKTVTVAGPVQVSVSASASPSPVPTTIIKKVPVPGPVKVVTKQVPQTYTTMSDGTYVVGTDIQPGIYKTTGPGPTDPTASCYWATLNTLKTSDINDNGNISGPTTIQVIGVKALELSGGCSWARIG